jgi:hypothetical protein
MTPHVNSPTCITLGTHKDCTYVGSVPKVLVPAIQGKDTKTVSLGATAGREPGGRRAAYPCSRRVGIRTAVNTDARSILQYCSRRRHLRAKCHIYQ